MADRAGYQNVDEPTGVDMLRDYECPDCEQDWLTEWFTEDDADAIFGGDENGFMRCPWCGEELELTSEAAIDALRMVTERMPELAPAIAEQLAGGSDG